MAGPAKNSTSRWPGGIGLGVGLVLTLAANLTATWPEGPVMIGSGLFAPLVLPLVLWVRSTFSATEWWEYVVREASVVAVAGPAAALSYWHTFNLMVAHDVPWQLAAILPLSADGVATISTLALHRSGTAKTGKTTKSTRTEQSKPEAKTAPKSLEEPTRDEVQSRRGERTDRAEWLRSQPAMTWSEQVAAVEREFSVSRSTAKRVVSQVAS